MRVSMGWLVLIAAMGVAAALWQGWLALPSWLTPPPQWNPWAPLDVRQAPNRLTTWKLARLRSDPQLCAQALASSPLNYRAQADTAGQCPLRDVIRVQGSDVQLSSSFLATCPMAVAFALFELHALQPAAQAVFGQRVTRVDHLGSFACRNVYNRSEGRRSQHATANAIDIASFRLADGRQISVLRGWPGEGDSARFLRQVHRGACASFNVVLGPDYNAAHRNHFHLDASGWSVCR
jgi:hypothetical protein